MLVFAASSLINIKAHQHQSSKSWKKTSAESKPFCKGDAGVLR
jgi:hypothetical protein